MRTHLDRDLAARQAGKDVDAAFSLACSKLGLRINATLAAPIALISLAQSERALADLEQRRARREQAA